jgi:photosystem II stability/assembly factor-like uncharacterized protein
MSDTPSEFSSLVDSIPGPSPEVRARLASGLATMIDTATASAEARSVRHRPRLGMRRATIVVTIAVVLAALFVPLPHLSLFNRLTTTAAPPTTTKSTASTSTSSPTVTTTSTRTPGAIDTLLAGVAGTSGWAISGSKVWFAVDAGQHWSAVTLPEGVSPSTVMSVVETPSHELWLATPRGASVELYGRQPSTPGGWSHTLLVPAWPVGLGPLAPTTVIITTGADSVVRVLVSDQLTITTSISRLFVSSNSGATFQQFSPPRESALNMTWWAMTFITPASGVVVVGPAMNRLFATSDGGRSWSAASVSGLPSGATVVFGAPFIEGSGIELPVVASTSDGGETLSLYNSDDGGATFVGPIGKVLAVGSFNPSPLPLANYGRTLWVVPPSGGKIFETVDNGHTWTTLTAPSLPAGVQGIALTSSGGATVVVSSGNCAQFKTDCSQETSFLRTTDGGEKWSLQNP